jgi:hypothetical protein
MARIRTIKPEFPQSESIGRVSRDARLLFIQLWTICDDSGRARADSRMLASLLYPYDQDEESAVRTSRKDIDGWLGELETQECLIRYSVDGNTYLQVCNWLNHQKIDKPSASKIPPFDESSRILANPREHSAAEGKGEEGNGRDLLSTSNEVDVGISDPDISQDETEDSTRAMDEAQPAGGQAPADRNPCPLKRIVELYHELLPELPRVEKLTKVRAGYIQQRWREDLPGVDAWRAYFTDVRNSKFLMGKTQGRDGKPPFRADLEWLTRPGNFAKVAEGKYHS